MTRAIAIFATGLWMFSHSIHAQSRTCRIVYPERPQGMQKVAYLLDGSKSHEVSVPSMNFSEVIHLADGEITLAITTEKTDDAGKPPASAPQLVVPAHVNDFYIILTADPANEYLPVKMNLADIVENKTGFGETLWCNFTAHRVAAKLGVAEMSVDPGGKTVSKAPADASGYYEARFEYQARAEGPMIPITEQNWWHDATSRSLALILDTDGRLPKIMAFRDFRETAKAE